MKTDIVELWAEIGSEAYWRDVTTRNESVFVPFADRWPQPGFVGDGYFDSKVKILVMGQNPRASNTTRAGESDRKMFQLIRDHSEQRTLESLHALFAMMRAFMLGEEPYGPAWRPVSFTLNHLDLSLDSIAYLNLIPLATYRDKVVPAFKAAFMKATARQLGLLQPDKIVVYGERAAEKFRELGCGWVSNSRHVQQRNYGNADAVKSWIAGGS